MVNIQKAAIIGCVCRSVLCVQLTSERDLFRTGTDRCE